MHQLLFFKKRYEAWPHPNGGTEKPVSPARAAGSHSASKYMLPHFVFSWGGVWGLCRTRLAEQKNLSALHAPSAAILPASTCSPILFFHGGYGGSAAPEWRDRKTCQFCTRRRQPLCQQVHALPFCFFIGGMGAPPPCSRLALDLKRATFCPHVYPWPLTFRPYDSEKPVPHCPVGQSARPSSHLSIRSS